MIDAEHRDISLMLDDDKGRQNIESFIEMNRPDIIFFDTLASFHNKNETNPAIFVKPGREMEHGCSIDASYKKTSSK